MENESASGRGRGPPGAASPAVDKRRLLVLLLGWPAAGLVGWLLADVTRTKWPAGVLPAGWFVWLIFELRRYASSASR